MTTTGGAAAAASPGRRDRGRRPATVAPLIAATALLAACLPPGGGGTAGGGGEAAPEGDRPFLVVRNDSDRPVTVRLMSGGAQVVRFWVSGLALDSTSFRRTLVSGGGRLVPILEQGGSDRVERLDPIALPADARAVFVVVRSLFELSYVSIR